MPMLMMTATICTPAVAPTNGFHAVHSNFFCGERSDHHFRDTKEFTTKTWNDAAEKCTFGMALHKTFRTVFKWCRMQSMLWNDDPNKRLVWVLTRSLEADISAKFAKSYFVWLKSRQSHKSFLTYRKLVASHSFTFHNTQSSDEWS